MASPRKTLAVWVALLVVLGVLWATFRATPGIPQGSASDGGWLVAAGVIGSVIALVVALSWEMGADRKAIELLVAAGARVDAGDWAAARDKLDAYQTSYPHRHAVAVATTRAGLLLQDGDLERARSLLDTALDSSTSLRQRLEGAERPGAHALRALLAAARDEHERVDEDAAVVLASEAQLPDVALARVAMARAVVAARAGDRVALRRILDQERELLLGATRGRERVLARALVLLSKGSDPHAYRTAAHEDGTDARLADWVTRFAPAAAPYAVQPAASPAALLPSRTPSDDARRSVKELHETAIKTRHTKASSKTLALWVVLIMGLLAFWTLLEPLQRGTEPVLPPFAIKLLLPLAAITLFVAIFAWSMRRVRRAERTLNEAERLLARGELDAALERATAIAAGELPALVVRALLVEAAVAFRRGRLAESLDTIGRAIGHLGGLRDHATPKVLTNVWRAAARRLRATVLAAAGSIDEALAEVEALGDGAGVLPFRVALFDRVHRRAFDEALQLARSRGPDLGTDRNDELVCDLLEARAREPSSPQVEAVRAELAADETLRHWAETVLPAELLAAVAP